MGNNLKDFYLDIAREVLPPIGFAGGLVSGIYQSLDVIAKKAIIIEKQLENVKSITPEVLEQANNVAYGLIKGESYYVGLAALTSGACLIGMAYNNRKKI